MQKNYHLYEEYADRKDLPVIRVEDIIFSSKYDEPMVVVREEEDANTLKRPICYTNVSEFVDKKLLRREVSTWSIATVVPGKGKIVDPFLEIYLKPENK